MLRSYKYYLTNPAQLLSEYPYEAAQRACKNITSPKKVQLKKYKFLAPRDPEAMLQALHVQPIAAAVASENPYFQFYSKGILFSYLCGEKIDHAILIVGYGEDSALGPFWIVKNSWGSKWGENGYFRIAREMKKGESGHCGINLYVSHPIL